MLEIWEKDHGYYLGMFTPDQVMRSGTLKGGLLYGFLIAITTEGIVTV